MKYYNLPRCGIELQAMSGALCEWSAVWSPGKEWNTSAGPWSWGRSSKKNDDVLSLHTNSIEKVWSLCFMLLFLCTYIIYIYIYIDIHRYLHIIYTQGINDYIYKWYDKEIHIYIYIYGAATYTTNMTWRSLTRDLSAWWPLVETMRGSPGSFLSGQEVEGFHWQVHGDVDI